MTLTELKKLALILALVFILQISRVRAQAVISGQNVSATGAYSSASGINTTASAYVSTAFGINTTAADNGATAFGLHAYAPGWVSTASGGYTQAAGPFSTAWGLYTLASGTNSTAFGDQTTASGYASFAGGVWSSAISSCSVAFGYASEADGFASFAAGQGAAWGNRSAAFGYSAIASGTASTAMGWNSHAYGNCSTASGYVTFADSVDSVAIGTFNIGGGDGVNWVPTDPLFEIGNGYPGNSSDALVVYKNGNTVITGSDNELPHQVAMNSHSILTEGLGDARYVLGGSVLQVGSGGDNKASVESTDSNYGELQVANPTSNGEASIAFISGATGTGDSPSSTNGNSSIWAVGADVYGVGGSTFGIGNAAYGTSILNVYSSGIVSVAGGLYIGGNVSIGAHDIWADSGYTSEQIGGPTGGEFILGSASGGNGGRYLQFVGDATRGIIDTIQNIPMLFYTDDTERMRITNTGSVGIGTTAPQAKLDVAGSTRMRGTVIVTGSLVNGTVVASGTNLALVPQQGDLSMGQFTAGATPQ
jgi:hypothetical protein